MKNLLYIVFLFVFVSACSTKPENKPYSWDDDLHQRLLTDFCLTESRLLPAMPMKSISSWVVSTPGA